MKPTDEQNVALALFGEANNIAIRAGAGTGKTTTLELLAQSTPRRGAYVAFNRAIVEEARRKMPSNVISSTAHSLAFKAVGKDYQHRLNAERVKSHELAKRLGMERAYMSLRLEDGATKVLQPGYLASLVMRSITRFCQTADELPGPQHVPYIEGIDKPDALGRRTWDNNALVRQQVAPTLRKAWDDLSALKGQLPFSHDVYLKLWELRDPRIPGDFLLFDEAQDAAPVMLSAVQKQWDSQLVFVGDDHQQIYEWRGAVNALDQVDAEASAYLTESFRFGQTIADVANRVLSLLGTDMRLTGRGGPSEVRALDVPDAVLTRSNAHAIERVMQFQREGRRPHLIGGGKDVLAFAKAAEDLKNTGKCWHPDLACFESWGEVQEYVENDPQGGDLKLLVGLVDDYGVDVIKHTLSQMPHEDAADVIVSTAHKAKGREWEQVQLGADFAIPGDDALGEWRLLYVAATRARHVLDVESCEALRDLKPGAAGRAGIPGAVS